MKDYDEWNNIKKTINNSYENKYYHEREIWWCKFGVNVGYEQDGSGKEFERPVLIVRGLSINVCLVVPLTTSLKKHKYLLPIGIIDNKKSKAIISQIRLIDTKRLTNIIGSLDKIRFNKVRKSIRKLF